MTDDVIIVRSGVGTRRVRPGDYLDAIALERSMSAAGAWIKQLRHIRVDGRPLRSRFTLRGDSLWWFAELYLHKRQTVLTLFRTLAALQRLVETERPAGIGIQTGDRVLRAVAPEVARALHIRWDGRGFRAHPSLVARMDWQARILMLASKASRLRPRGSPTSAAP